MSQLDVPVEAGETARLEPRKAREIEHYDERARTWLEDRSTAKWPTDVHGLEHRRFSSYALFERWIGECCRGKRVLDYGCGTGIHSLLPAACGAEVIGVDLSVESLKIARERIARAGLDGKVNFVAMDCEALDLPSESVDVVLDGGTFSSLDLDRALPEIVRVLKPDGCLLGIETLGHNPFANLKREINVYRGVRTAWAGRHILRVKDLEKIRRRFAAAEIHHFHLLSLSVLPFVGLAGMRRVLHAVDRLDSRLLALPFLKRYAFKAVFKFSEPKRDPAVSAC